MLASASAKLLSKTLVVFLVQLCEEISIKFHINLHVFLPSQNLIFILISVTITMTKRMTTSAWRIKMKALRAFRRKQIGFSHPRFHCLSPISLTLCISFFCRITRSIRNFNSTYEHNNGTYFSFQFLFRTQAIKSQ